MGVVRGSQTQIFKVIAGLAPTTSRRQVYSGNLYFGGLHASDYTKTGIYAVGRPTANYNWGVTLEFQATASSDTSNPSSVNGFYIVDDYMWLSHSTDSVTKIFNSSQYLNTSIVETQINPNMNEADKHKTKDLVGVRVNYVPLASGTIVAKYKVDSGSYTTIFSHTTATGESSFESRFDTNGAQFASGREYQFRLESTNGVEITGLEYLYQNNTKDQI